MELAISLLITGIIIVIFTFWRGRRLTLYKGLQDKLHGTYDTENLDLSGNAQYTNCRSYEWVLENITRKKPSKIGGIVQQYLMDNTLLAGVFLAFIIGLAGMIIGFLFILSIITTGTVITILLIGLMVIIGPGNPRTSEELIMDLLKEDLADLNKEDFVYVSIGIKSIQQWLLISLTIGAGFIVLAPWGETLPQTAALIIATFAEYVLWAPAIYISTLSIPIAILYLFFMPVLLLVIIPGVLYRRVRKTMDGE